MKIVVNTCYGGFRLSHAGLVDYFNRKGKTVYLYEHQADDINTVKYVKIDSALLDKTDSLSIISLTKDFGDIITDLSIIDEDDYASACEIERNDPDLVATVEELKDTANCVFSKLRIVEIPDDVDWEISDYDGIEHVEEKHRKWYANRR